MSASPLHKRLLRSQIFSSANLASYPMHFDDAIRGLNEDPFGGFMDSDAMASRSDDEYRILLILSF